MISVIIPTLNAERTLAATLTALVPAAVDGLVREVIIADGGSTDRTVDIAEQCGADVYRGAPGRGPQLMLGAARARFPWFLFLHADTVPEPGWERECGALIDDVEIGRRPPVAAAFRFGLDDAGIAPRALEALVSLRCAVMRLPYGDQGLLIPRALYEEAGGFRALPLMEDIDLLRRVGRNKTALLRARAVTSAARYRREGYMKRVARNQLCLALFLLRAPMASIVRIYGTKPPEPPPAVALGRSHPAE